MNEERKITLCRGHSRSYLLSHPEETYCFYKPGIAEQELQTHLRSKKPSSEVELSMTRVLVFQRARPRITARSLMMAS